MPSHVVVTDPYEYPARVFNQESDRFPAEAREKVFIAKIRDYHKVVSTFYNDPRVIQKVKEVIPWDKFKKIASEKADLLSSRVTTSKSGCERELIIMELLDWFKNDFFSWYDHAVCNNESCCKFGEAMSERGSGQPTIGDMMFGASRVETYKCQSCGSSERFPRFNHPLKLLETRKGRCGEWANMLTCILTVYGFDCRLVLDFTDHVWTEVYNEHEDRWIHVDSCERSLDSPLLYETGWGKKLTYCIALHKYEIQDVTWRYVSDLRAALTRRDQCSESWLSDFIVKVNNHLRQKLPNDEKHRLLHRSARELIDLLHTPWNRRTGNSTELLGRQSGSEAWRLARNEMGHLNVNTSQNYIFEVNRPDVSVFEIQYNAVTDEYTVNGKSERMGWASATYAASNIVKKVEHDWKMVYLSRPEGSPAETVGEVSWLIDFQDFDWSYMCIRMDGMELDGSRISISIMSIPSGIELLQSPGISVNRNHRHELLKQRSTFISNLSLNEDTVLSRDQFPADSSGILILAHVSGGSGDMAWQKGQLFRQSLVQDRNKCTLIFQLFKS
jgi:peptide-N4-(N-acetyl-beta-glucosaminyl)asparagine amidase